MNEALVMPDSVLYATLVLNYVETDLSNSINDI